MNYKNSKNISEATSTISSGKYKVPLALAAQIWKKESMEPFTTPVSDYFDAINAYDSYDGEMERSPKQISKAERKAVAMSKKTKSLFSQNDDDGNPLNGYNPRGNDEPGTPDYIKKKAKIPKSEYKNVLVKEATESTWSGGDYNVPLEVGSRTWKKNILAPFEYEVKNYSKNNNKTGKLKKLISKHIKTLKEEKLNEDLAVWFGTKKKPKGSSQPKGPWVNICRKKEGGGHPPCGRPEAENRGYPKCRAAGVASKMTDSQKKSACAQKRRAEKTNPKIGTGNSPRMTSYKPRKESIEEIISRVLKENFR